MIRILGKIFIMICRSFLRKWKIAPYLKKKGYQEKNDFISHFINKKILNIQNISLSKLTI